MPYRYEYVPADIAVDHEGVIIYHAYKDGLYEQPLDYWYNLNDEDSGEFDIRALANYDTTRSHVDILKEAIDNGAFTED